MFHLPLLSYIILSFSVYHHRVYDRAAYATRSDGVRNLIGQRTESDRVAFAAQ